MRLALSLALLLCAASTAPALAYSPVFEVQGAASGEKQPCDEQARLAFVVQTEAFSQPWPAQVAIAQIVVNEAASRGMSVCGLSEHTNFVSVYHYAQAHPDSWAARQLAAPQTWALELAQAVLDGQLDDEKFGAGHFDGRAHDGDLFVIGDIHFRR